MINKELREEVWSNNSEVMFIGQGEYGYDEAIIGHTLDGTLIYDYDKLIESFMVVQEWPYEDAAEWVDYNIVDAYMGEYTPIISFGFDCIDFAGVDDSEGYTKFYQVED